MKFPLLSKALAVGTVLLALMAGLGMVSDIVAEREGRLREAEHSVADGLAASQALVGPLLQRQCAETRELDQGEGKDRKRVTERREFSLLAAPSSLAVSARSITEPRYRGIFKVHGYTLKATVDTRWALGEALTPVARHADSRLSCDSPTVVVAVGDARGIRAASLRVDGVALEVAAGTRMAAHPRGFHAVLPAGALERGVSQVELTLDLVGTGSLAFAPVAQRSEVTLVSDWPHPAFEGRFLPVEREVGEAGFTARWRLTALATTAPSDLLAGAPVCGSVRPGGNQPTAAEHTRCIETFGVDFIDPVSGYRLSDRATKYGLLFIALTFLGVGLVEVLRRLRVHPVQYLLVGSALLVFFLLLLSLTEHLPFAWAYGLAAGACTVLLGFYGRFVLGGARAGLGFGTAIAALYGTLYMLLQLEQSALLLGSLLLFVALGATMVATRRIDWYALMGQLRRQDGGPPASAG